MLPIQGGLSPLTLRRKRPAAESTLLNNLIAYWKLDEASGNRADSHTGGYNLGVSGSPPAVTGKIGNGVRIANATGGLLGSNSLPAYAGGSFTVNLWFKPIALAASVPHYVGSDNFGTARGWAIEAAMSGGTTPFVNFRIYFTTTQQIVTWGFGATSWGALGVWRMVTAWYDAAAKTMNITADAGATVGGTTATLTPITGSPSFYLNRYGVGAGHDSSVDEIGYWSRVLTADERTELYAAGAGASYPFV